MKKNFSSLNYILNEFGFTPKKLFQSLKGIKLYLLNYFKIKKQVRESGSTFPIEKLKPCLSDRFENAGTLPGHYFHLDLYTAKLIFKNSPERHVDVGSRIDGFAAHIATFREIEIFDIRKFEKQIPNIKFIKADLSSPDFPFTSYCDSLSCLHALEHFGLGRYGDTIDINGHLKGFNNLYKMLKKNGRLYFAVPIGKQRIEFNAHRVFSIKYLINLFEDKFKTNSFSYIDDHDSLFENVSLDEENISNNFNCNYGCGIFELIKL